jgi:hypothetical protein
MPPSAVRARSASARLTLHCWLQGHATDFLQVMLKVIVEDKQGRFAELFWRSWELAHAKQSACACFRQRRMVPHRHRLCSRTFTPSPEAYLACRAEVLRAAATLGMTEAELQQKTEEYVKRVTSATPGADDAADPDAWRVQLAELYELADVDRSERTAMHAALLKDTGRDHVLKRHRTRHGRELKRLESTHGISKPTRAAYRQSQPHLDARAKMIAKKTNAARQRIFICIALRAATKERLDLLGPSFRRVARSIAARRRVT